MSTNQAAGEPSWWYRQQESQVFGDFTGTYTLPVVKADNPVTIAAPNAENYSLIPSGDAVLTWKGPAMMESDVSITKDGVTISMRDIEARLRRLEDQVEMWKSAAMTLKEINDELQIAADEARQQALLDDAVVVYHERRPAEADPVAAYERAKKHTR